MVLSELSESPIGIRVYRAAAREVWLDGELSCPCCPIFLEDEQGQCWKLFYDDEICEWQIKHSNIPFPEIGFEAGDNEIKWIDVDLKDGHRLIGKTLTEFSTQTKDRLALGSISFDEAVKLQVEHSLSDDASAFKIESAV